MPNYTIRVYGLWINEKQEVLLSDERIGKLEFTKFPGGGLEQGEGTKECLIREWQEEVGLEINVLDHFYTTDFYQASAFHKDTQIISIYYLVEPNNEVAENDYLAKQSFSYLSEREEVFRFVALNELNESILSFPIDKHVVNILLKKEARNLRAS